MRLRGWFGMLGRVASAQDEFRGLQQRLAQNCVQLLPFQCSIRVFPPVSGDVSPTAHTLDGDMALTPASEVPAAPPGFGVATWVQWAPFQWSARDFIPLLVVE